MADEKAAADKAVADKAAADKAAVETKTVADKERVIAEKAAAEQRERDKAAIDKAATTKPVQPYQFAAATGTFTVYSTHGAEGFGPSGTVLIDGHPVTVDHWNNARIKGKLPPDFVKTGKHEITVNDKKITVEF